MRSFLPIIFILISFQSLFAGDKGTINGKVTDEKTGEELVGANIYLKDTSFGTSTDFEGKYTINNIPSGKYILIVKHMGYISKSIKIKVKHNTTINENIELQDTVKSHKIISLNIIECRRYPVGSIKGKVIDEKSGKVLAGAIILTDDLIGAEYLTTTTDSDGNYSLADVRSGTRSLTITNTGYVPESLTIKVPKDSTLEKDIILKPLPRIEIE